MADIITVFDLPASIRAAELVDAMVAGANARASRVAPCLVDAASPPSAGQMAEAKLVLIGAVSRWVEAGSGALQQQTAGPFSQTVDTRPRSSGYHLWPSEIKQLQEICAGDATPGGAFEIDTAPVDATAGYWSTPSTWVPL